MRGLTVFGGFEVTILAVLVMAELSLDMARGVVLSRLDGLTVSTQKFILKNMHRFPRYRPKCVQFCWLGLEGQLSIIS